MWFVDSIGNISCGCIRSIHIDRRYLYGSIVLLN